MRSIFFAPHSDDECLFGAFTLLKYQPTVVICFPSSGDYGDTKERFNESVAACLNLGVSDIRQWQDGVLAESMRAIDEELNPDAVWSPAIYGGHLDHSVVAFSADSVFGKRSRHYDTYSLASGAPRKDELLPPVLVTDSKWVAIKHFALTKYQSQIAHPRARQFFTWDLTEYAEQP